MIRRVLPDDAPAVADVVNAAYSHYIPIIGRTPRPMLDDHAARIARGEHFVYDDGTRVLAGITLTSGRQDALHIYNIAVRPDAQGSGLLLNLLAFAEQRARHDGLHWLTLYTNLAMLKNRAIYAHLGFTELGEEDAGGYRIVFMERKIPAL